MKIGIIGSGLGGLVSAAYLAKAGHEVHIFEHSNRIGGVLAPIQDAGFKWDLGQLLVEGFEPGEPFGDILEELGVSQKIQIKRDDRRYVFPDFSLDKPKECAGLKWRIEKLREMFPEEETGLKKYWKYYVRLTELFTLGYYLEKAKGIKALYLKLVLYSKLLTILPMKDWSAEQLMNHFFKSKKLQTIFISILADFFIVPSKFLGLGVFTLNPEISFDHRLPPKLSKWGKMWYFHSIIGGISTMADAFGEVIKANGGVIHLNAPITKIRVQNNKVSGLVVNNTEEFTADLVISNGGARETFYDLIGKEYLPSDLIAKLNDLPLMDGVFMIHLGLDFDPAPITGGVCTYYYGTYEFEEGVAKEKEGYYHEGKEGFVIHVPTTHTPTMAPIGKYAATIYTICPDKLQEGTWTSRREEFADKLLQYAEQKIPDLRKHIVKKIIMTPDDFKQRLRVNHFAFGGLSPEIGKTGISFKTFIPNLYYVGAQSQTGGGVSRLGIETAKLIKNLIKSLKS